MITHFSLPHMAGFQFARPVRCLSSAILGGGLTNPRTILNLHVPKGYSGMAPAADLQRAADEAGCPGPVVGLMTAVQMEHAVYASAAGIHVLATAGVANAEAAGLTPPWEGGVGTINIIAFVMGNATDAALAGAAITLTEAKARALADAGVRCSVTGAIATGTTSDAFAVAAGGDGPELPFLGPATREGYLIGWLTYKAVTQSLRRYQRDLRRV